MERPNACDGFALCSEISWGLNGLVDAIRWHVYRLETLNAGNVISVPLSDRARSHKWCDCRVTHMPDCWDPARRSPKGSAFDDSGAGAKREAQRAIFARLGMAENQGNSSGQTGQGTLSATAHAMPFVNDHGKPNLISVRLHETRDAKTSSAIIRDSVEWRVMVNPRELPSSPNQILTLQVLADLSTFREWIFEQIMTFRMRCRVRCSCCVVRSQRKKEKVLQNVGLISSLSCLLLQKGEDSWNLVSKHRAIICRLPIPQILHYRIQQEPLRVHQCKILTSKIIRSCYFQWTLWHTWIFTRKEILLDKSEPKRIIAYKDYFLQLRYII